MVMFYLKLTYFITDIGVRVFPSHKGKLLSRVDVLLWLNLATFTEVEVCNSLFFLFLRANYQDFQLRNLRIIEPNELTYSGDPGVETGNNFASYFRWNILEGF